MELVDKFERYAKLPSSKSIEGLSHNYYIPLRKVLIDYENDCREFDTIRFIEWLNNSKYSYSSKTTFATGIASFAHKMRIIDAEDKKLIYAKFRHLDNDWSSAVLSTTNIAEMIEFIQKSTPDSFINSRNVLAVMTLSAVGIRVAQLCGIEYNLVKAENDVVWLPVLKQKEIQRTLKKNSELKPIPFAYTLGNNISYKSVFDKYNFFRRLVSTEQSTKLFISRRGLELTPRTVQLFVKDIGEKIGIKVTPHTFRHYAGQRIANKFGILKAQVLLGHSQINTTQKYINPELINIAGII